jgi:hypothetical protein
VRLFRRRSGATMDDIEVPVADLDQLARARGWERLDGNPLLGGMSDAVGVVLQTMYGHPTWMTTNERQLVRIGDTLFRDSYGFDVDGRRVVVTNAWKNIQGEINGARDEMRGVAVCSVELPAMLPIACVQPRRFKAVMRTRETPTGDPSFDAEYRVFGQAPLGDAGVLAPPVRARIAERDDWIFRGHRAYLACVGLGPFRSGEEVTRRVDEVLGVVGAFPASAVPATIDHSGDDIIERALQLHSVDEAIAFLQNLTDAERDRLRSSSSPLSALADGRTPAEVMELFQGLDQQQKLEILAMVQRVKGDGPGR